MQSAGALIRAIVRAPPSRPIALTVEVAGL